MIDVLRSVPLHPAIAGLLAGFAGLAAIKVLEIARSVEKPKSVRTSLLWIAGVLTALLALASLAVALLRSEFETMRKVLVSLGQVIGLGAIAPKAVDWFFNYFKKRFFGGPEPSDARASGASLDINKPSSRLEPKDFRIERYNSEYIRRPGNDLADAALAGGQWVLFTGKPMAGKTRAAYEAARQVKSRLVVSPKPEGLAALALCKPQRGGGILLFLDDLQRYAGSDLERAIERLSDRCKDLVVLATCRTGDEMEEVREGLLSLYRRFRVVSMDDITREQGVSLARETGGTLVRFDGTPGSVILDLEDMRQKYRRLGEQGKAVMRTLKLLQMAGLYGLAESQVRSVGSAALDLTLEKFQWDGLVASLSANGFVRLDAGFIQVTQDVYLDFCVDDYDPARDMADLLDWLLKQSDHRALATLGGSLVRRRDFRLGRRCFEAALELAPSDSIILNGYGYALEKAGEAEEARGRFPEADRLYKEAHSQHRAALGASGSSRRALAVNHHYLGYVLSRIADLNALQGRGAESSEAFKQAEQQIRSAVAAQPDFPQAHRTLSYVLSKMGDKDGAEQEIRRSLEMDPSSSAAHNQYGFLLAATGRFQEAESEYRKTLELKPDTPSALSNLAHLLTRMGRAGEAVELYNKAIGMSPEFLVARLNLGRTLVGLGRVPEAVEHFRFVLSVSPQYAEARTALGYALSQSGDLAGAEEAYRKAIAAKPELAEARRNLAWVLARTGRFDEARVHYEKARELNPEDRGVLAGLALVLEKLGEIDQAERLHESLCAKYPGDDDILKAYSFFLLHYRKDSAVERFDRAVVSPAGAAVPLITQIARVRLLTKAGRSAEAVEEAKRLSGVYPAEASVWRTYGMALEEAGDGESKVSEKRRLYTEAEQRYRRALSIRQDYPAAQRGLAGIMSKKN